MKNRIFIYYKIDLHLLLRSWSHPDDQLGVETRAAEEVDEQGKDQEDEEEKD